MKPPLFDILVYVFERFLAPERHSEKSVMARELSLAGFDESDIQSAFDWLGRLDDLPEARWAGTAAGARIYIQEELRKLAPEGRGFLAFMESSGLLAPVQREWVLDRLMALPDAGISAEQVKWVVLLALWKQGRAEEYLFLEDVLFDVDPAVLH
jgi:Smg protein